MRKIALLGLWHVHAGQYYSMIKNECEVVGVWDDDAERLDGFCERSGLHKFESREALLASDADAVVICTATSRHPSDIIAAARAHKDIFSEKILAISLDDCEKIKEEIEKAGVDFVISFPHKAKAPVRTMMRIAKSGELGKINYVRFRNCHNGRVANWLPPHFYDKEACGGGAMIDLGAHGMYLIDDVLGLPDTYSSTFTNSFDDEVEDNAVTVMGYKNGAIAINETSFVANCCPVIFEICGERGKVFYEKGKGIEPDVIMATLGTDCDFIKIEDVEEALTEPVILFARGEKVEGCGIDEAIRLSVMMDGAYKNIK